MVLAMFTKIRTKLRTKSNRKCIIVITISRKSLISKITIVVVFASFLKRKYSTDK